MKKLTAAALSSILLLLAPGLQSWAAAAQIVAGARATAVPVRTAPAQRVSIALPSLGLTPTLSAPALSGSLSAAPSVKVAPAAGAAAQAVAPVAAPSARVNAAAALAAPVAPVAAPAAQAAAQAAQAQSQPGVNNTLIQAAGELSKGESAQLPTLEKLYTGSAKLSDEVLPSPGTLSAGGSNLAPAQAQAEFSRKDPPPPSNPNSNKPAGRGGKFLGALKSVALVALGAGAVIGLQAGAVALLPAVFGVVPVAAVWAVASGVLLLPAALYARYRLAKRDSPALSKAKVALDLFIGAYLGGVVLALPGLGIVLASGAAGTLATTAAVSAGGTAAGLALSRVSGNGFVDMLLSWASLSVLPMALGIAGAGAIGIGSIFGMAALPAMTTIAFFLGRIIHSAETGDPFTVPGSLQKIRFPAFQWVMSGVVFALLTGFSAVYTNWAFIAWNLFGNKGLDKTPAKTPVQKILKYVLNFNTMYLGVFIYAAFTGFTSPLTFLVIAFAVERASHWTERLLQKLYPRSEAAPSTKPAPAQEDEDGFAAKKWPKYHHWLRTGLIIASMLGMGALMAGSVFGWASLAKNLGIAALLAGIPVFISNWLIKKTMKAQPADPAQDPELFQIMGEFKDTINAERAAKGKKAIPLPELVSVPMEAPNAFATGRSPFKATVGVTLGIKQLLLDPETVRDNLTRLLAAQEPGSKSFKVFRKAIAGSIPGIKDGATAAEVTQAIARADEAQLKALGYRMLRGVLAHEFTHVMDRHMITGAIAGAISSGVAFASYGVMWAVGHAQAAAKRVWDKVLGRSRADDGNPDFVEPISTGVVMGSLLALLRVFAALWAPIILQITQMTGSRNNENQADEGGALLSQDPESLALALGMLTTWRPTRAFKVSPARVPLLAAWAHLFTVNPLQQLDAAGALPKNAAADKADNFLLELFITHPDTRKRIERLFDMSEALRPSLDPSGGGGGARGSPLAFRAPAPKTDPAGSSRVASFRGLFQRAWAAALRPFRVLSDKDRNREFWKFLLGQAMIVMGGNFHYTALPKLAAPTKEDAPKLGYNRAVNNGAQALSSLTTGTIVDRTSVQKVLVWTQLGRTVLMLAVPILFFNGYLTAGAFLLVIGMAGFLQMTSVTAGSVALNRILGPDEAEYNRANAVYSLVTNIVGVIGPLLAGAFIGAMDLKFGFLAGNALSYGVYGLLLLGATVLYGLWLQVPRDELLQSRRDLMAEIKKLGDKRLRGVTADRFEGKPRLLVEVRGDPAELQSALPQTFAGYPVKAIAERRIWKEMAEGFRLIWNNRFLKVYMLFSTLSMMASDALVFSALPRYIEEVVGKVSTTLPGVTNLPVIGPLIAGLTSKAGAFGIYLAVASLGILLSSAAMSLWSDKAGSGMASLASKFRRALKESRGEDAATAAAAALRSAPETVLARHREAMEADPSLTIEPEALADEIGVEAVRGVAAALKVDAAEAGRVLLDHEAASDLRDWTLKHHKKLTRDARREAKGGLDPLQRQGRWSSILHGLGWLAYWGVFFSTGLWGSVGAMLAVMLLQGPAMVIWTSLLQKVLARSHPESMGKIYSAIYFYQLVCAIAGVLVFGWLLGAVPTGAALLIAGVVVSVAAFLDFIEPWVIFRKGSKGRR